MILLFIAAAVMLKISPHEEKDTLPVSAAKKTVQSDVGSGAEIFREKAEKFVAHRGYSNYAPENSIPAFELAGKHGFWGIETDIYETTDGQFVCLHDDYLDRTTNGTGKVTDYSLEQLETFRIDSGSNVEVSENLKIPTLQEYLEICVKYDCVAVVEIKTIQNYDEFLGLIYESGATNRCIIMSGNINDIKEIRARNTGIPVMVIGYGTMPYTDNVAAIAEIPDNRGILFNYPQVDRAAIDIVHEQNIYCGVWSVDEKDLAEAYLGYGADFVVTNEIPAALRYKVNENE